MYSSAQAKRFDQLYCALLFENGMFINRIMHFRKRDCFHLDINSYFWRVFFFSKNLKGLGFSKKRS